MTSKAPVRWTRGGRRWDEKVGHSRLQGLGTAPQAPGADLFEEATQVLLEDHHDDDDQDGEEALQDVAVSRSPSSRAKR
jgi:hypothetical protein